MKNKSYLARLRPTYFYSMIFPIICTRRHYSGIMIIQPTFNAAKVVDLTVTKSDIDCRRRTTAGCWLVVKVGTKGLKLSLH